MQVPNEEVWEYLRKKGGLDHGLGDRCNSTGWGAGDLGLWAVGCIEHLMNTKKGPSLVTFSRFLWYSLVQVGPHSSRNMYLLPGKVMGILYPPHLI